MSDFVIELGDHVIGDDNNYKRDNSAIGKVARCIMSAKGKWPGGRGESFGCDFWNKSRQKASETSKQQLLDDFKDALTPLIELGIIRELNIAYTTSTREDAPRIRIAFYDIAIQKPVSTTVEIPWGS